MGRENEPVRRERTATHRMGKLLQGVIYEPIHSAREQGREIIPRVPQPVAAGQQGDGRALSARQIQAAGRRLLSEEHRAALLREPVEINDNVDRGSCERDVVPPQKQIRLGPGMRQQHRRVGEIGLAQGNAGTQRASFKSCLPALREKIPIRPQISSSNGNNLFDIKHLAIHDQAGAEGGYREANPGPEGAGRERKAPEITSSEATRNVHFRPTAGRLPPNHPRQCQNKVRCDLVFKMANPSLNKRRPGRCFPGGSPAPKCVRSCKDLGKVILTLVGFFMVRPAFPSVIERRTALRSMVWCDPDARS